MAAPERVGPYRLLERIGTGGMADVFLAVRDGDTAPSVVKLLRAPLEHHEIAPQRMRREAHLASLLFHPNIARLRGAGEDDGRFYAAYELVPGETLGVAIGAAAARGDRVPAGIVLAVARSALDALEYAHDLCDSEGKPLDVVHRDVTPGNLMIGFDGVVRLIDFGVAHASLDKLRTAPGMAMGTLRYFAPEQACGDPVDRRTDLYALGAVIYEAYSGTPLIAEADPARIFAAILEDRRPSLAAVRPDVAIAAGDVLVRALARERASRYQDAASMRRALLEAAGIAPAEPPAVAAWVTGLFPEGRARVERWHQLVERAAGSVQLENAQPTVHAPKPGAVPAGKAPAERPRARRRSARTRRRRALAFAIAALAGVALAFVLARLAERETPQLPSSGAVAAPAAIPRPGVESARERRGEEAGDPPGTAARAAEDAREGLQRDDGPAPASVAGPSQTGGLRGDEGRASKRDPAASQTGRLRGDEGRAFTRDPGASQTGGLRDEGRASKRDPAASQTGGLRGDDGRAPGREPGRDGAEPSSPSSPPARAGVRALLAELRAQPADSALFARTRAAIAAEAAALPADARERVRVRLENADRYPTAAALESAYEALERARSITD